MALVDGIVWLCGLSARLGARVTRNAAALCAVLRFATRPVRRVGAVVFIGEFDAGVIPIYWEERL